MKQHLTIDVLYYKNNRFYYKNDDVLCTKSFFYYKLKSLENSIIHCKGEPNAKPYFFNKSKHDRI